MAGEGAGAAWGPGPELIMVAHAGAELRVRGSQVLHAATDTAPLSLALKETGAHVRPLFALTEEQLRTSRRNSPVWLPDLSIYYTVDVSSDHEGVAARLAHEDAIDGAYVKPPAVTGLEGLAPAPSTPTASTTPAAAGPTPDFTGQQGYLGAPPGGVNASAQWSQAGGDGTNVQVIVVGGSWQLTHDDLVGAVGNGGQPVEGTPIDAQAYRDHGTAMLGLIRANRNTFGVSGIAPNAQVNVAATFGLGTAPAIQGAAALLPAGSIICIEWQRPGPGSTGVGSAGFIALEWWPEDFAAMTFAASKNIIVIAPAGNGSISLDDPVYDTPAPGFPSTWTNPFHQGNADSGAVIVGAGAPPSGNHGPDRSRLAYSNYGSRVNMQGWGEEIVTTGYGDLFSGGGENQFYTDTFRGTSGAAAMVAGAIAVLQGVEVAGAKRGSLTPPLVRQLLRTVTMSPQQDGGGAAPVSQNIGPRPDLGALIASLSPAKSESKDAKDAKNESKDSKDSKDNKDTPDTKQHKDSQDNKDNKDSKDGKDTPDTKLRKDRKDLKEGHPKESAALEKALPTKEERPLVGVETGAEPQVAGPNIVVTIPVQHFIDQSLRPDLSTASLRDEPDIEVREPEAPSDGIRPEVIVDQGHE